MDGVYSDDYTRHEPLESIDTGDARSDDPDITRLIESIEAGEQAHHWRSLVESHEKGLVEWMCNQTGWAYNGEAYRHGIND